MSHRPTLPSPTHVLHLLLFGSTVALTACGDKDADPPARTGDAATTVTAPDEDTPVDADGDGYPADEDCDDTNAAIHPGATEVCDDAHIDEDCSGAADDDDPGVDPTTRSRWYMDADLDGFGDPDAARLACDVPPGAVADDTDCDDSTAAVNPGATEVCDAAGVDEDCSLAANDDDPGLDLSTATTWYTDADGDGFGDPSTATQRCEAATDHVTDNTDCSDGNDQVYPGATEWCDDIWNDCNDTGWFGDTDLVSRVDSAGVWTDVTAAWTSSAVDAVTVDDGDTIHICEGTYTVNITLDGDATLYGHPGSSNVTLDGDSSGRVIVAESSGADVVLTNLIITGGLSASHGGGLVADDLSSLFIERTTFTGNTATEHGGGLYTIDVDDLWLGDVTLSNNDAGEGGGGMFVDDCDTFDMDGVTIDSNHAAGTDGRGGADVVSVREGVWDAVDVLSNTCL